MPNHKQGHFGKYLILQFHVLHSMRSHPYEGGVIPTLGYLRYYNNLEKLPPSVQISIDLPILIFSTFGAFSYYCIIGSVTILLDYFSQVVLEILKKAA